MNIRKKVSWLFYICEDQLCLISTQSCENESVKMSTVHLKYLAELWKL